VKVESYAIFLNSCTILAALGPGIFVISMDYISNK
jgi:hypothetical protein